MKMKTFNTPEEIKKDIKDCKNSISNDAKKTEDRLLQKIQSLDSRISYIEGYLIGRDSKTKTGDK